MDANGEFVLSMATASPGVLVSAPAIRPTTLGVSMSNVDCIESLHDLTVTLYSGDKIYITRSRKQNLMKKMAERGGCM